MDRNQAKEFFPIMQAFAEGRVIECRTKPSAVKGTSVPNYYLFFRLYLVVRNRERNLEKHR